MKSLKRTLTLWVILITLYSCILDKKTEDEEIESFYISKNFGQFPVLPLSKPIKLHLDDQSKEWRIEYLKHSFNQYMRIEGIDSIGVEKTFIYGKTENEKQTIDGTKKGDLVYARKFGGTLISQDPMEAERVTRVYPIDSISKTYIIPERWFIINVADSTTEAFFSKNKYDNYLKEKGISGRMYNINKYHEKYKETGILPWFPDSIKVKLKK